MNRLWRGKTPHPGENACKLISKTWHADEQDIGENDQARDNPRPSGPLHVGDDVKTYTSA